MDARGNVLLDVKIKTPNVFCALTASQEQGVSREAALKKAREILGPDVLLVGPKIRPAIALTLCVSTL